MQLADAQTQRGGDARDAEEAEVDQEVGRAEQCEGDRPVSGPDQHHHGAERQQGKTPPKKKRVEEEEEDAKSAKPQTGKKKRVEEEEEGAPKAGKRKVVRVEEEEGKAKAARFSEVVIQFHCPPHLMFPLPAVQILRRSPDI